MKTSESGRAENASREFTVDKIKRLIHFQKEKYDRRFIFLGANIDAVTTAAQFGIEEDFAVDYHANDIGTILNYEIVGESVINLRSGKKSDQSWKGEIERDYQ